MKLGLSLAAGYMVVSSAAAIAAGLNERSIHQYESLALSDDGLEIATIDSTMQSSGERSHTIITIRQSTDGRIITQIDPCPSCDYSSPRFCHDTSIVFVATPRVGQAQVLRWHNGRVNIVAKISGIVDQPSLSPDSQTVAFLATINAHKALGAEAAGIKQVGELSGNPDEQRIAIAPSDGHAPFRFATQDNRYVYEYSWRPDSRGFVLTSSLGDGDANWWIATLDAVDADGTNYREIIRPKTQIRYPHISPDGQLIAFIGGVMSDFDVPGGDVWTVPVAGGSPTDITRKFHGSVIDLDWQNAGLRGTALINDKEALIAIDPSGHFPTRSLWSAGATLQGGSENPVGGVSVSGDMMAAVEESWDTAPFIVSGRIGRISKITHDNEAFLTSIVGQSVTWKSSGNTVQGWLLKPTTVSQSDLHPMITVVHGGPSYAWTPSLMWEGNGRQRSNAALLRSGYWLFFPNPRGSFGQGERFAAALTGDLAQPAFRDIIAGIDAVERIAPIDDQRLGMTGHSYGGLIAIWANTQTQRFKAFVAGAGVSDLISFYGTTRINTTLTPFYKEGLYRNFETYSKASAVRYADRARTPTLLTAGEDDLEVPPTQSIEWWNALRARDVPSSLIIYPGEGHSFSAKDFADEEGRTIAWFDLFLKIHNKTADHDVVGNTHIGTDGVPSSTLPATLHK